MDSKISEMVLRMSLMDGELRPPDPIPSLDLISVIQTVITLAYSIAGVAAVGFVIYGGYTYMASTGDPQKIEKAQRTLANAVIGLALVIVSGLIIEFVAGLFGVENLILFLNLPDV